MAKRSYAYVVAIGFSNLKEQSSPVAVIAKSEGEVFEQVDELYGKEAKREIIKKYVVV